MITIEKAQLDTLQSILQILGIFVTIVGGIVTIVPGLLFWYIRKVDKGGKRRLKEQEEESNRKIDSLNEICTIQAQQIATFENTLEQYRKQRVKDDVLIARQEESIKQHLLRIRQLEEEIRNIKDSQNTDGVKASTILTNATKLILALNLSEELGMKAIEFLEGRLSLEDFVVMIKKEMK